MVNCGNNIPNNIIYTTRVNSICKPKINNVSFSGDTYSTATERLEAAPVSTKPLTSQYNPNLLLKVYNNENFINQLMKKNPQIGEILKSVGIDTPVISTENLSSLTKHITATTEYALEIADKLGLSAADKKVLEQAAIFHDFGKVLMPEEIINKSGKLDKHEREIIDTHAAIGAELLKTAGMNKRVTDIIKNHHTPTDNDILCNILSVADIYSALREERSYKKPMRKEEALSILDQKAEQGEVSTEVVNALKICCII